MPSVDTPAHQFSDPLAYAVAHRLAYAVAHTVAHPVSHAIAYTIAYAITHRRAFGESDAWTGRRSGNLGRFLVTARFRNGWRSLPHWRCHRCRESRTHR